MAKRFLSLTISAAMLWALLFSSSALTVEQQQNDFNQIWDLCSRLLGGVEHEKEMYGLAGVNFDNLYLGDYIPSYICTENGLTESDIRIYPILENGEWVATLQAYETNGIWNAQLSNIYADKAGLIGENTELSMVFDKDTGYLRKNGSMTEIVSYDTVMGRAEFSAVAVPATRSQEVFQTAKLENRRKLIPMNTGGDTDPTNLPSQKFIDVPLISKHEVTSPSGDPKDNLACWAASVRAIGKAYGKDYSIDKIYEEAKVKKYIGAKSSTILNVIENLYKYTAKYDNVFRFSNIQTYIASNYIVLGAATKGSEDPLGHAVAICGYERFSNHPTNAGSISYVENEYSKAKYVSVTISHSDNTSNNIPFLFTDGSLGTFVYDIAVFRP